MQIFGKEINRPSWVPRWMSFTLAFSIFMIVSLFFTGPNNFMRVVELKTEIKNKRDTAAIYEAKSQEFRTDKASLERLAREKYGMKRLNEDVYITDIP